MKNDTSGYAEKMREIENFVSGASLQHKHHRTHAFRRILIQFIGLGVILAAVGKVLTARGDNFLGDFFSGVVVEIVGAILTFWLIDTVWQKNQEEHDFLETLRLGSIRVNDKHRRVDELLKFQEALVAEDKKANPTVVTSLRLLVEDIHTDVEGLYALYSSHTGKNSPPDTSNEPKMPTP